MDIQRRKELIEEYKATQDMYKYFNTLKWQVGSVLIGAIAVAAGFVFSSGAQASQGFPFLFFFSSILMGTWLVYGERCILWSDQKTKRLQELEKVLDFKEAFKWR